VTHGLCDAERPDKAPHDLMLRFNVGGNRPESDKFKWVCRPAGDDTRPPPARVHGQLALPAGVGRNRGVAQHNDGVGDAEDLDKAEGVR